MTAGAVQPRLACGAMSELMTNDTLEAVLLFLGIGITVLVSLVQQRRCRKCWRHWAFHPNGFTDDVGEDAREEWQCEHCGYRKWKPRTARFTFSKGD